MLLLARSHTLAHTRVRLLLDNVRWERVLPFKTMEAKKIQQAVKERLKRGELKTKKKEGGKSAAWALRAASTAQRSAN